MLASMLATISCMGFLMGQVEIPDLLQNFDFSLGRSPEEMFTTHFALSTLFKLRYQFTRLFSYFACLLLILLWTERPCVFRIF